ncbi:hypothetical protein SISNIDRAFT_482186 [Sistotremastrum niveocremeum HHB9708]|uniref:Fungal-type protein kinase domain-containing protein n=1 Tax=Sistotremastrum niveocremeum HHB9708 TaxID=1314777 RepID=A0A164YUT7_9AGAM|nr:hypothetical protein SISNIDRAFT_482186 [Sistotremastrum niveocremeum HHB9708]
MALEKARLGSEIDFVGSVQLALGKKRCQGMSNDIDAQCPIQSNGRLGTLPYMALWLLGRLTFSDNQTFPHSALQDLESFMWIIILIIMVRVPTSEMAQWPQNLGLQDTQSHRVYRKGMAGTIVDMHEGTIGLPITNVSGPRQLFVATAHTVVGHYIVHKGGWLHRDVSIGNIMLLKRPIQRPRVTDLGDQVTAETSKLCQAMLIDADHVVRWWDRDHVRAEHRSGTLPYLSLRLLHRWIVSDKSQDTTFKMPHSAMDDLESFVWVIFHVIIIFVPTRSRKEWLAEISSQDRVHHLSFRRGLRTSIDYELNEAPEYRDAALAPFVPFLSRLFALAEHGQNATRVFETPGSSPQITQGKVLDTCNRFYREFLAILFEGAATLPET